MITSAFFIIIFYLFFLFGAGPLHAAGVSARSKTKRSGLRWVTAAVRHSDHTVGGIARTRTRIPSFFGVVHVLGRRWVTVAAVCRASCQCNSLEVVLR